MNTERKGYIDTIKKIKMDALENNPFLKGDELIFEVVKMAIDMFDKAGDEDKKFLRNLIAMLATSTGKIIIDEDMIGGAINVENSLPFGTFGNYRPLSNPYPNSLK